MPLSGDPVIILRNLIKDLERFENELITSESISIDFVKKLFGKYYKKSALRSLSSFWDVFKLLMDIKKRDDDLRKNMRELLRALANYVYFSSVLISLLRTRGKLFGIMSEDELKILEILDREKGYEIRDALHRRDLPKKLENFFLGNFLQAFVVDIQTKNIENKSFALFKILLVPHEKSGNIKERLLRVFSKVERRGRGFLIEVINAWRFFMDLFKEKKELLKYKEIRETWEKIKRPTLSILLEKNIFLISRITKTLSLSKKIVEKKREVEMNLMIMDLFLDWFFVFYVDFLLDLGERYPQVSGKAFQNVLETIFSEIDEKILESKLNKFLSSYVIKHVEDRKEIHFERLKKFFENVIMQILKRNKMRAKAIVGEVR